jgi:hypothetical protein
MTTNRQPKLPSRLPGETAYWDALARRIVKDELPVLESYRNGGEPWWAPRARLSTALLATAALAAGAAVFLLPASASVSRTGSQAVLERALVPQDPLAERFFSGPAPPTVESLLLAMVREEGR